ncbi:hypothetical protein JRQ81_016873 [Phrynocephalus forsythii]|uniref:SGNH hydrolase-type esterase domain-containing protein n=1 Tax=Phrynocephalus forsythii TaxID=171643 RepID=A0A9Q1B0Z8_9SAUR|nr:hypothetical protein JRQ81_016873 [Phrynocephalus forsythii]
MLWDGFSEFLSQSSPYVPPDILVIHLGGNDLAQMPGKELILKVTADLSAFNSHFPQTRLVWFTLVPHIVWRSAHDPRQMDKARKGVNKEVARAFRNSLCSVTQQPEIRFSHPELNRQDGVHLSDLGLEIFLRDLQGSLEAELLSCVAGKEHTEQLLSGGG